MKLVSFGIQRYRSILKATHLPVHDGITILVGPNNEGKSNLLRGLVTAMEIVKRLNYVRMSRYGRLLGLSPLAERYAWDRDFPIGLQPTSPAGESHFDLEFELTVSDILAFKREVGSVINQTLGIRISLGTGEPSFSVLKRGLAKRRLSDKRNLIAAFIGKRVDFQYIPALRSAKTATQIVEELLERELHTLDDSPGYQAALKQLAALQAPLLKSLGNSIRDTLKAFLPSVTAVTLRPPAEGTARGIAQSYELIVDDGVPTPLARKGDGVQSLAALGLMRFASQRSAAGKHLVLAIEEPESHLHPAACRELRRVIEEISKQHQVIATTHNPVFVQRRDVRANIIVSESHASSARSIAEIRDILGVRVSDNLRSADVLLIVEGEDDRRAFLALLPALSSALGACLSSGTLAIDSLVGSSNLAYRLAQLRDSLCAVHCFLDNDAAGKQAAKRALSEGLACPDDITYAQVLGLVESELEDLYNTASYEPHLQSQYGLNPLSPAYSRSKKKWSDRMALLFASAGATWDDAVKGTLKADVASRVAASAAASIDTSRRGPLDRLVAKLEALTARA